MTPNSLRTLSGIYIYIFSLFHTWWSLAKECTTEVTTQDERRIDAFWRTIITDMGLSRRKATPGQEGNQFRFSMSKTIFSAFEPEDKTDDDKKSLLERVKGAWVALKNKLRK